MRRLVASAARIIDVLQSFTAHLSQQIVGNRGLYFEVWPLLAPYLRLVPETIMRSFILQKMMVVLLVLRGKCSPSKRPLLTAD